LRNKSNHTYTANNANIIAGGIGNSPKPLIFTKTNIATTRSSHVYRFFYCRVRHHPSLVENFMIETSTHFPFL